MAMAEEIQIHGTGEGPKKRKFVHMKGKKGKKKVKVFQGSGEKVKIDRKMKKLIRKRVRDYNSDEEDEEPTPAINYKRGKPQDQQELYDGKSSDEDDDDDQGDTSENNEVSDDEDGEIQPGITKLTEGCKAFRMAFKKITKTNVSDDVLGPVLSAHKKLVAEKLAEEEVERKVKGDAKKEKHLVGEKGHVKPLNYLDVHEKFLIGVATKGVVKLFNAVNKAQSSQKGLNPSRSKDAKELQKRRKQAFFSELGKTPSESTGALAEVSRGQDGEGPSWAPLRDNYMLTNSKLKDWDKIADEPVANDFATPTDSSSDDE